MGWDNPPINFIAVVEGDVKDRRNEIALAGHQGLVLRSPVLTGRYRGSHILSIGRIANSPSGIRSAGEAISSGQVALAGAPTYTTVFVSTNLPYARDLENGGSKQAPNGVYGPVFNSIRVRYTL